MHDLLPLSIGIGLAVSLLFSEAFAIAAGGMIVPGYIALSLRHPLNVLVTIAAGLATYAIDHALSSFVIIYGRRRTVTMILVGYLVGAGTRAFLGTLQLGGTIVIGHELQVIGFIIPGLIAIWLDRQGIVETISAMATASVVVRLVLILVTGMEYGA